MSDVLHTSRNEQRRRNYLVTSARVGSWPCAVRVAATALCPVGRPVDRLAKNPGSASIEIYPSRSLPSQPREGPRTARPLILRGLISMNKFRTPSAHGTGPVSQADVSR
jgi:hypothetical protein